MLNIIFDILLIVIILIFISLFFMLIYIGVPTFYYRVIIWRYALRHILKEEKCNKEEGTNRNKLDKKTIYLTFDDGPSIYTLELLELLKREKVKATFFVVGDLAKNNPNIIKKVIEHNHMVGLHSMNHKNALLMMPRETLKDMIDSFDVLYRQGVHIKLYRAPWGMFNLFSIIAVKKYNLKQVFWTVMAEDWKGDISYNEIEKRLYHRVRDGSVICLHDGRGKNDAPKRTIKALESLIPKWKEEGYNFETMENFEN